MKSTEEIIQALRDFKIRSAEKYGIVNLGLFGSVARGEQSEDSDIDVCIKLRENRYHIYMDIKEELENLFCTKIDLVTLHENMKEWFRHNLERDAIFI